MPLGKKEKSLVTLLKLTVVPSAWKPLKAMMMAVTIKPTIATIFIIPNQNSVSPKNLALSVFKAVKAKRITVSVSQTGTLGNQNWI